jgi:hypothetical protein
LMGGWLLWQRTAPAPQPAIVLEPTSPAIPAPPQAAIAKPPVLSAAEVQRLAQLDQRRRQLEIPADFWDDFLAERFDRLHPELAGRDLTPAPADAALRQAQAELAEAWLERLGRLNREQRSRLGSYQDSEFDQWLRLAEERFVSRDSFLNRVNLKLAQQLPELLDQGDGAGVVQVQRAIASTVISTVRAGNAASTLTIDPAGNAYRRATLQSGEASLQLISLKQGQNLRINLDAPAQVKLALYRPGDLDSPWVPGLVNQYWEGKSPETGLYQIRVTSAATGPVEYSLNLIVE